MVGKAVAFGGVASGLLLAWPAAASETITYTYDARGRLVAVVRSGDVNNNVQTVYTYDAAGNRTNVTVTGVTSGSGGDGGGGGSNPPTPSYRVRYVFNGRFYVAMLRQEQ